MIDTRSLPSRFGIAEYQAAALGEFLTRSSFEGARVLEVGGSNLPSELVFGVLGAKEWVCIDIIDQGRYQIEQQRNHYSSVGIHQLSNAGEVLGRKPYVILNGSIEDAGELPSGYFDAVISVTSFEHILAMPTALAVISKLKAAQAPIFSYHGPIWSGRDGHHVYVDEDLNFNNSSIPEFGHLLMRPAEMFSFLSSKFGAAKAQRAILQIYNEPRINRLFFEDYSDYFLSIFKNPEIASYGARPVPDKTLYLLQFLYPRCRKFEAYGQILFAR